MPWAYSVRLRYIERKGEKGRMKFKNKHYISGGVDSKVNPLLQCFMWHCIDDMPPKDYLQVFKCSVYDGKQKITHIQEEPEYEREYLIISDTPFLWAKSL
jgi:hypothetical protein